MALARAIIGALGLDARWREIKPVIATLLEAYARTFDTFVMTGGRRKHAAMASVYLAANKVLLPQYISCDAMVHALSRLPQWATSKSLTEHGIKQAISRFSGKVCNAGHDLEQVERGGWMYETCKVCYVISDVAHQSRSAVRSRIARVTSRFPVLVPVAEGAMELVSRCMAFRSTEGRPVHGNELDEMVPAAIYHQAKLMGIAIDPDVLHVRMKDYVSLLSDASASKAPPSPITDAAILTRACDAMATVTGRQPGHATRARVEAFLATYKLKLMGFAPATKAALLAYIDLAIQNKNPLANHVAGAAGSSGPVLHNAIKLFLQKLGKQVDPTLPVLDRVIAAFGKPGSHGGSYQGT